jgi:hypothetical protein
MADGVDGSGAPGAREWVPLPTSQAYREDRAPAGGHARSHPATACLMTTSRSAPVTERECPQMPQNGRSSGHAQ